MVYVASPYNWDLGARAGCLYMYADIKRMILIRKMVAHTTVLTDFISEIVVFIERIIYTKATIEEIQPRPGYISVRLSYPMPPRIQTVTVIQILFKAIKL